MKVFLIVLAVVLVLAVLLLPVALLFFGDWPANGSYSWLIGLRDVALVYASLFMCVGALMLVAVTLLLVLILSAIRENIVPALQKVDDTAKTVRGTATFVSESVVAPIIKTAGAAAGARAMVQTLMRRKPPSEGK